jgi:hypothetical protein
VTVEGFGDAGALIGASYPCGIRSAACDRTSFAYVNAGIHGSETFVGTLSFTLRNGASVSSGFVVDQTVIPVGGTTPGHHAFFCPCTGPPPPATPEISILAFQQRSRQAGARRSWSPSSWTWLLPGSTSPAS